MTDRGVPRASSRPPRVRERRATVARPERRTASFSLQTGSTRYVHSMNVHPLNAATADPERARPGVLAKAIAIAVLVAALVAINALVVG